MRRTSSPAIFTSTMSLSFNSRSSSRVATGCSTYSRKFPATSPKIVRILNTASSTLHEPFTSIRIFALGKTLRTRAIRTKSSRIPVPTFTLTVSTPGYQERICSISLSLSDAGTVALTGIVERFPEGKFVVAASIALSSHGSDSRASYSRKGANSPQPSGPSNKAVSRTSMPRNLVFIGSATTRRDERASSSVKDMA